MTVSTKILTSKRRRRAWRRIKHELKRQVKFFKIFKLQKFTKQILSYQIKLQQLKRTWRYCIYCNTKLMHFCSAGLRLPIYTHLATLITTKIERRRLYWKQQRRELRTQVRLAGFSKALKNKNSWQLKQLANLTTFLRLMNITAVTWFLQNINLTTIEYLASVVDKSNIFIYSPQKQIFKKHRASIAKTRLKRLRAMTNKK